MSKSGFNGISYKNKPQGLKASKSLELRWT